MLSSSDEEEENASDTNSNDKMSDEGDKDKTYSDIFMPTKPKMGGVIQSRSNKFVVWTGGKPKEDWSDLDNSAAKEPLRSLQLRTLTDKKYSERISGSDDKFDKRTGDFSRLQDELVRHMEKHGMDTIAYLQDPKDSKVMLDIVIDHPKFTHVKVKESMEEQVDKYDKYDRNNDASARDYLLDSLEKDFRREFEDQSRDAKTFPKLFMVIVRIITDDSIEHWESVKSEMRALIPHKYPGHDITLLTKDFATKARCLSAAGLYEHTLTASLLKNILKAKWPETPKFALLTLNKNVQEAVEHIRFMDKSVADTYMGTNRLLYTHVTEEANNRYLVALKQGEWSAKSNLSDSKAPPASFGGHQAITDGWNGTPTRLDQASINALVQQLQARRGQTNGPSGGPMGFPRHNKGKEHNRAGKRGEHNKNNKSNKKKERYQPDRASHWKNQPPAPGASDERMMDGTKFYWCGKCKRWNTTHKTSEHVVGYNNKKKGKDNKRPTNRESRGANKANCLEIDPSAWQAELDFDWHDGGLLDSDDDDSFANLPALIPRTRQESIHCPPSCKLTEVVSDSDDDDLDSVYDDMTVLIDTYCTKDPNDCEGGFYTFQSPKTDNPIFVVVADGEGVEEALGKLPIDEALCLRLEDNSFRDFCFVFYDKGMSKKDTNSENQATDNQDKDDNESTSQEKESIDHGSAKAKREGMRYHRAAMIQHASTWQEPPLS